MMIVKKQKVQKLQKNKNKKQENTKQSFDLTLLLKYNENLPNISTLKNLEYLAAAKNIKKLSPNTCQVTFKDISAYTSCKDFVETMTNGLSILSKNTININKVENVVTPKSEIINLKENETIVRNMYRSISKFIRKKIAFPEAIHSNTIIVKNLPKTATQGQVQELFPDALNILVKYPTETRSNCIAIVVVPNIEEAMRISKSKLTMDDNQLVINVFKPNKYNSNK